MVVVEDEIIPLSSKEQQPVRCGGVCDYGVRGCAVGGCGFWGCGAGSCALLGHGVCGCGVWGRTHPFDHERQNSALHQLVCGQNKQKTKCKKSPILFQQDPEASTHSKSRKRDIREPAEPGTVKLQNLCTQPQTRALFSQGGALPNRPPYPLPFYQGCVLPKVLLINRWGGGGAAGG